VSKFERDILAVVLTHNAPETLARSLEAIIGQSTPPEAILVVDNASSPPAMLDIPPEWLTRTELVRSDVNTGPAGGYAQALAWFLDSGHAHAWVLDDDMLPESVCLERLWEIADRDPDRAFIFPVSRQRDGSVSDWPSWCGFIVSHQIVLPMAELFWWAEDTEYLQWRIPQAGYPRQAVAAAVVNHDAVRQVGATPMWKYYYEARNMLYVHLHVKHRVGRYPRNVSMLVGRAVLREGPGRARRLSVIARGLVDGARGRLGIRYPIEPMRERGTVGSGPAPIP
jgi:rhamnopyranosyl-N-acetylglucosaminyl-diphospho-decaprenol beta-1,3/1,4-galactofuranosyltransferase